MKVDIMTLGAGQKVGRSCILVIIEDKRRILDCGVYMGNQTTKEASEKKYPDFEKLK